MTDNQAPVAESLVGLLLLVILGFSWWDGEVEMAMLSLVLVTGLAIARAVVR